MANQKSCSGTNTIGGFFLANPACNYNLNITIDGTPIINTVSINSGMTGAQIAALLNSNRTGNTTGTFSVSQVGNDLEITITGIVLSATSLGVYNALTAGTGGGCPSFLLASTVLTCSIIHNRPSGGGGGIIRGRVYLRDEVCFNRKKDLWGRISDCDARITIGGQIYELVYFNEAMCCYRKIS